MSKVDRELAATEERAGFSARLREALEAAGFPANSPTQLARQFNAVSGGGDVTVHAARKWLVGEAIPTQEKLRVLAQIFGTTPEWLRFGDTGGVADASVLPNEDALLLSRVHALNYFNQRTARDFIALLLKNQEEAA